jgi:hypothetical protein
MKLCSLVLLALFSLSARAQFQFKTTVTSPEVQTLLSEAAASLPAKLKAELNRPVVVEFTALDSNTVFKSPCVVQKEPQQYGTIKNGKVLLHKNLLPKLKSPESFACGHQGWVKHTLATLIHETIHLWEKDRKMQLSESREYTALAMGTMNHFGRNKLRNTSTTRLPDAYELKNTAEHFAVNTEYFLLDPEYACRRPLLAAYFSRLYQHEIPTCEPERKLLIPTAKGAVPFAMTTAHVKEIHYLMASKGEGMVSSFGHSMLRLVTDNPNRDIVVGFVAQVDTLSTDTVKGLTGQYPSKLFVNPLSATMDDYNKVQLRDLHSYPLELDEAQRQRVLDQILAVHWEYAGKYYFVSNNCADEALNILKGAGVSTVLMKKQVLTPYDLRKVLRDVKLITEEGTLFASYRETQEKIFARVQELLGATFETWLATPALARKERYEALTLTRPQLFAALSVELSIARKIQQNLQARMGKDIYALADADETKKLAQELVHLQGLLNHGAELRSGYGIPQERDFSALDFDAAQVHGRVVEINQLLLKWAIQRYGEAQELEAAMANQLWIQQKLQ